MARRSTNVLAQTNQAGAVRPTIQAQNFRHSVQPQVSSSAGVDPFAGRTTLANAFQSFFGDVSSALGTMQEAEFAKDKLDAQREATRRRQVAASDAYDMARDGEYGNSAKDALANSQSPYKDQYGYSQAFQEAYGNAVGGKLLGDFELAAANAPKDPKAFDAWTNDWFDKNFADGTGSPIADMNIQAAFSKQHAQLRVQQGFKAIEEQRGMALEAAGNSAMTMVQQKGGWGYTEFNNLFRQVQGINPTMPEGKVRAATLDLLMNASAMNGTNGLQNFLSFIDQIDPATIAGDPNLIGQSLSDRFPLDMQKLRIKGLQLHESYRTAAGVMATQGFTSQLSTMVSETEGNPVARLAGLKDMYKMFGKLENTPGVTMSMLQGAKGEYLTQLNQTRAVMLTANRMEAMANPNSPNHNGGVPHPSLDAETASDALDIMAAQPGYNVLQDPSIQTSNNLGQLIEATVRNFGAGAVSGDIKNMLMAGLKSDNQAVVEAATRTIRRFGGQDLSTAVEVMGDELAPLLSVDNAGNVTVQAGLLKDPEVVTARETLLADKDGINSHIIDDFYELKSHEKIEKRNEWFTDVAEQVERNFGQNGWLGNGSTPALSPQATQLFNRVATEQAAIMLARHGTIDKEQLKMNTAAVVGNMIALNDNVFIPKRLMPDDRIPIATSVVNPSGITENVMENMNNAADGIADGLRNFTITGTDSGLLNDGSNFMLVYNEAIANQHGNAYQVIDSTSGLPFTLGIGDRYTGNVQYNEEFEKYPFYDWNDNEELEFQFSGNLATDELMMKRFVHPSIKLIPNDPTNPTFYHVGVEPHFTQVNPDDMTETELKKLSDTSLFVPKQRRTPDYDTMSDQEIQNLIFP